MRAISSGSCGWYPPLSSPTARLKLFDRMERLRLPHLLGLLLHGADNVSRQIAEKRALARHLNHHHAPQVLHDLLAKLIETGALGNQLLDQAEASACVAGRYGINQCGDARCIDRAQHLLYVGQCDRPGTRALHLVQQADGIAHAALGAAGNGGERRVFGIECPLRWRCGAGARQSPAAGMRRKSKRWQRLCTVAGILWGSVVARIKRAWGGGSSSVFSSALKALVLSICTSSMM